MRALRCTLAVLVTAIALFASSLASADTPLVLVLILGPSAAHPTVVRFRDELQILGLQVVVEAPRTKTSDLASLARDRRAAAVALIEDWPPEIVVWVDPSRQPGEPADRAEIRVSESMSGPVEPSLLALRAIELLRGKLIPVSPPVTAASGPPEAGADTKSSAASTNPAATHPTPRPPPDVSPEPSPASTGQSGPLSAFVAGAVLLSPGSIPATAHVRIGGSFMPHRHFGIEAIAFLPTAPATIAAPEGSIDLRALSFGAGPVARLTGPDDDLAAVAGLGMGAMLLLYEGSARSPFIAAEGSLWTALPYGSVGISYRLYSILRLRTDIITAITLPEPIVRAAAREVASVGRPAVFVSLGLEVRP